MAEKNTITKKELTGGFLDALLLASTIPLLFLVGIKSAYEGARGKISEKLHPLRRDRQRIFPSENLALQLTTVNMGDKKYLIRRDKHPHQLLGKVQHQGKIYVAHPVSFGGYMEPATFYPPETKKFYDYTLIPENQQSAVRQQIAKSLETTI
jgi:hypothetical protein